MIKPAYSFSFLLSINASIFVWQNVLYFPNALRTLAVENVTKFVASSECRDTKWEVFRNVEALS